MTTAADILPYATAVGGVAAALGVPRLFRLVAKTIGDARTKKAEGEATAAVIDAKSDAHVREADSTAKRKLEAARVAHDAEQENRVFERLMKKVEAQDEARDKKIALLEQHVSTLEKERDAARSARDELHRTAQELAARATTVGETLARTERRVMELTATCTKLEELLVGAKKQIEELRAALHVALLEKADLEAQLERERARGATG
jgi:chromosome segregation ATPase